MQASRPDGRWRSWTWRPARCSGELPVAANNGLAVGKGRVYLATEAGLDVIDPSRVLAPSARQALSVRMTPTGNGKVHVTVNSRCPAGQGSSAVTGYRIEVIARDPARDTVSTMQNDGIRDTAKRTTGKASCTVTLRKVSTSDNYYPDVYTVTVRAVNANGLGAARELSVEAK